MNRLAALISNHCPDGVPHRAIGEISKLVRGTRVTRSQLADDARYPVVSGGAGFMGFLDQFNREAQTTTIAQYGTAGYVAWRTERFWANDICFCVEVKPEQIRSKFLYYLLSEMQNYLYGISNRTAVPFSIDAKKIEAIRVPVPPLPVQDEIVRILDTFALLEAELEAELDARKIQIGHYRDVLFKFDDDSRVRGLSLEDFAHIGTGSRNTNQAEEFGEYPFFVRSQNALLASSFDFDEKAIVTAGDGVGVGKVLHYVDGKYALHQRAYRISPKDDRVLTKYLFHFMKKDFARYLETTSVHASVTSLRKPMFEKYKVPVPTLKRQMEIITALDALENLVSDSDSGIPAEIEARRRQYEYYRDQLLTFKEA
jgi:type I restriction enzyme S subunit